MTDVKQFLQALRTADAHNLGLELGNEEVSELRLILSGIASLELQLSEARARLAWIPVSERLPETGKLVLVTIAQENVTFGQYIPNVETWLVYRPDVGRDIRFWVMGSNKYHVTHWMHLPQPPEVKE